MGMNRGAFNKPAHHLPIPPPPICKLCFAAAKWETAAPFFSAGLAGTVDVCLGFPALTAQLAKFGWTNNGTWCPQTGVTASWYPLKRQVRGRVALGGSAHALPLDMVPPGATGKGRPSMCWDGHTAVLQDVSWVFRATCGWVHSRVRQAGGTAGGIAYAAWPAVCADCSPCATCMPTLS